MLARDAIFICCNGHPPCDLLLCNRILFCTVKDKDLAREILDRVSHIERQNEAWREKCSIWDRMFSLDRWTHEDECEAKSQGRRLTTSPMPKSVVRMATRLLKTHPRILCSYANSDEQQEYAGLKKQLFLEAIHERQSKFDHQNPWSIAKQNLMQRGRSVIQVLWVKDLVGPNMPPIRIKALDPKCSGVESGELGPMRAYHKKTLTLSAFKQSFPDAEVPQTEADDEIEVIDYQWVDLSGGKRQVKSVTLADSVIVEGPREHKYGQLTIMEAHGDPIVTERGQVYGAGILDGLEGVWEDQCLVKSLMLTGTERAYFPQRFITQEFDSDAPEIDDSPGSWNQLEPGQNIVTQTQQLQQRVVQDYMGLSDTEQQQATFSSILYGNTQSLQVQSGYPIGPLTSQSATRVQEMSTSLAALIENANEVILEMVELLAGPAGITVSKVNENSRQLVEYTLTPGDIDGNYINSVIIDNSLEGDQLNRMLAAAQLNSAGLMSRQTIWETFFDNVPADERERLLKEYADFDPNVLQQQAALEFFLRTGIELPPGEPDGQLTPQQPQGEELGVLPQFSPQAQLVPQPNDVGLPQNVDPAVFDAILAQEI